MAKISLTDESGVPEGRWFDDEKATKYEESVHWDGSNNISDATGSQWDHETLFRTAQGNYVLEHRSQWAGKPTTYQRIDQDTAMEWLASQGHHDAIPKEVLTNLEI